ncbi:MAG: hypothetical protein ACJA02_001236 [Myxococcota bacterium]|jgi:hypothetical protein
MSKDKYLQPNFDHQFFYQKIKLFRKELEIFYLHMFFLSDEDLLNLMAELVPLKESLEDIEVKYLEHSKK